MALTDKLETGVLLLASPSLTDPMFNHSVVFIISWDDRSGAVGLILNKPADFDVRNYLNELSEFDYSSVVTMIGGPVGLKSAFTLVSSRTKTKNIEPNLNSFSFYFMHDQISLDDEIDVLDVSKFSDLSLEGDKIRAFCGLSVWSPGQLEDEIEAGAWLVTNDFETADLFSKDPSKLWEEKILKLGPSFKPLLNYPDDPNLN